MSTRPPGAPTPIATAAERAARWALSRLEEGALSAPPDATAALALAHVCSLCGGRAAEIARLLCSGVALARPALRFAEVDLLTGLLAASLARSVQGDLAAAATEYMELLHDLTPVNAGGPNGVLQRFAFGVRCEVPVTLTGSAPGIDWRLLRGAHLEGVRLVLATVEASSAFGTVEPNAPPVAADLLGGAALAALRAYDLPLGMRLLRALGYVSRGRGRALGAGLDFVRGSQRDDGGFGDFEGTFARMSARGEGGSALGIELHLAIQALWTMAELEDPSFRLVRRALGECLFAAPPGGDLVC